MATNWGNTVAGGSQWDAQTDRVMYLGLDAMTESGTLDSVSVWTATNTSADDWRFALYEGVSAGTPANATLVADLGLVTTAASTWNVATASGETLTSGKEYWIGVKSIQSSGSATFLYDTSAIGDAMLSVFALGDESNDETDAWDATVPNPSNELARCLAAYITYTAASGPSIPVLAHHYRMLQGVG